MPFRSVRKWSSSLRYALLCEWEEQDISIHLTGIYYSAKPMQRPKHQGFKNNQKINSLLFQLVKEQRGH